MDYRDAYLLAGAEDLSREYNDLAGFFSDLYKDVYGFRPKSILGCADQYESAKALAEGLSHLKSMVDELEAYAPTAFAEEERQQKKATDDFEAYVLNCLQVGATSRADAIAWICDSYGVANQPGTHGWEHLEYLLGIPFGYISGVKPGMVG